MSTPRLSIVVPSFNQGRYIGAALDSILTQNPPPHEVIVIDGASSDDTVDILRRYAARHPQLRWRSERDDGPADAVNKGLAEVSGDWIGICSSDDLYCAGAFEHLVHAIRQAPETGFFYGDVAGIDENGRMLGAGRLPEFSWPAMFAIGLALPQGSIFFRADVARAIGGWNPAYYSCDLDYWLRMLFRTPARKIPAVLSYWRIHPEQRTRADRVARIRRDYERMIAESPDLAAASPAMRRWARASCRLWTFYEPARSHWRLRREAALAWPLFPSFPRYLPRQRLLQLVPGYGRARALYRRLFAR